MCWARDGDLQGVWASHGELFCRNDSTLCLGFMLDKLVNRCEKEVNFFWLPYGLLPSVHFFAALVALPHPLLRFEIPPRG